MKNLALILLLAVLAVPVLAADHPMATESGWFDLGNCAFCKNLLTDPHLLEHMTWETHKTESGMMYISTCDAEYAASFAAANQAMEKLGNDMASGQVNPMEVKMCGSCVAFSQLTMAGVKMENIDGEAADVMLFSSSDPALVARLHEYADRNNAEMAELIGGAEGHDGHDHHGHEGRSHDGHHH